MQSITFFSPLQCAHHPLEARLPVYSYMMQDECFCFGEAAPAKTLHLHHEHDTTESLTAHHWEPAKLLLRLSGPLSARRILRERWFGLPMSSSAGVRGVLGARPLLSQVRAVSSACPVSPERLPASALSCRPLQDGNLAQ